MKQLSNTPEAVAAVTGLSPEGVRNRLANLFCRSLRTRAKQLRDYSGVRSAAALLQTMDR
jgi:hypothetical protein